MQPGSRILDKIDIPISANSHSSASVLTKPFGSANLTMAAAEPWRKFLDEEIQEFEKGSVDEDATIVIRDVLAANSTSELLFKEAALRLDKHDKSPYLTYDPMVSQLLRK